MPDIIIPEAVFGEFLKSLYAKVTKDQEGLVAEMLADVAMFRARLEAARERKLRKGSSSWPRTGACKLRRVKMVHKRSVRKRTRANSLSAQDATSPRLPVLLRNGLPARGTRFHMVV